MTQKEQILKVFKENEWVPGIYFINEYPAVLQYHARIFELQEEGYKIIGRKKEGEKYFEYRLVNNEQAKLI